MTSHEIKQMIDSRVSELELLLKTELAQEHRYALKAGIFELLDLKVKIYVYELQE